jgi:hypothetical protein
LLIVEARSVLANLVAELFAQWQLGLKITPGKHGVETGARGRRSTLVLADIVMAEAEIMKAEFRSLRYCSPASMTTSR